MCDPVSIGLASFGISAAQTVAGFVGQRQQAKATRKAAIKANANEQNALVLRQQQEAEALSLKKGQYNIQEAQKLAEVQSSAAASGVSGITLDNLLADVSRVAATNRDIATQNTNNVIQQLNSSKKGSAANAQSRINSAPNPSPFSLVAGLGGAALGGFNSYNKQIKE